MAGFLKRTWAEIDLDAILHNCREAKAAAAGNIMAVVKADAYGHGVRYVAPALEADGVQWFGVSNLEEALQLRSIGIAGHILILGFTPPECAAELAARDISQTVYESGYGRALFAAARDAGVRIKTHIKLDTGMNRLGFDASPQTADQSVSEILALFEGGGLLPEGLFTHFASSDLDGDPDGGFTREQSDRFHRVQAALEAHGLRFSVRHLCPSGGIYTRPGDCETLVRPGIMLYGFPPSDALQSDKISLRPALSVKSVVIMVKTVRAGDTVGYGRAYTAESDRVIATVPIGYADGYPRVVSNRACMLVRGKRARIAGRVCMDQLMLDVTDIPGVRAGDIVTAAGADGGEFLPVTEISALAGTIPYETLCMIGKRVPRVFFSGGKEIGQINYITESFPENCWTTAGK